VTSSWINSGLMLTPEIDRRRAAFVLGRIGDILSWERTKELKKDVRFVELGEYLCEVRARQYWRLDNLNSFDEISRETLRRFAKAYYLIAIHEKLTRIPKHELQQVGWSKATELLAHKDGETFDCATWLHKAKELPKEGFKCAVERHLTGKETEAWKILYFKAYKSQLPVVEKALETAALMLGTDNPAGIAWR
jgi:hypothetical protein